MPTPSFFPPAIVPARNPVWVEVPTDGYIQAAPVASVTALVLVAQPNAGQRITLTLPDGSTTWLEAVAGPPDDSGNQYTIGASTTATAANMVATAQLNHRLLEFYTATADMAACVLTARSTAQHTPTVLWDSPPWGFTAPTVPGSNGTYAPGYSNGITLWVEEPRGSNSYRRLPDVAGEPGADGRVRFNIGTLLLPYTGYNWPALGATAPLVCTDLLRKAYMERWEAWGDPVHPRAVERSGTITAWYAGTRQADEHPAWSQLMNWLPGTNVAGNYLTPWLTYRDRALGARHEVSPAQQHYLGWYHRVPMQSLQLRATIHYTDGTSTTVTALSNGTVPQGSIALWPTGWNTLALGDVEPAKTAYKYSVQLRTATGTPTAVSEAHTFWLVPEDANELHIEFLNSLGAVESLRTVGQWVQNAEAAHAEITAPRTVVGGAYPATHQAAGRSLLAGVQHTLQVSTGMLDKAERDALLDLLYSPEWRLVDRARNRKLPLRLVGSQQVSGQQGTAAEHLHALDLQFVLGDPEMAWSDMPALPAQPPQEPELPES